MKVQEFRDLIDAVTDGIRSLQSARVEELDAEASRLQLHVKRLRECEWPKRLSGVDRHKAQKAIDRANALITTRCFSNSVASIT